MSLLLRSRALKLTFASVVLRKPSRRANLAARAFPTTRGHPAAAQACSSNHTFLDRVSQHKELIAQFLARQMRKHHAALADVQSAQFHARSVSQYLSQCSTENASVT